MWFAFNAGFCYFKLLHPSVHVAFANCVISDLCKHGVAQWETISALKGILKRIRVQQWSKYWVVPLYKGRVTLNNRCQLIIKKLCPFLHYFQYSPCIYNEINTVASALVLSTGILQWEVHPGAPWGPGEDWQAEGPDRLAGTSFLQPFLSQNQHQTDKTIQRPIRRLLSTKEP